MTSLTIHGLDESIQARLKDRAAVNGRSEGDEARAILHAVLAAHDAEPQALGTAIHALFKPLGGFELPDIPRDPMREPPIIPD